MCVCLCALNIRLGMIEWCCCSNGGKSNKQQRELQKPMTICSKLMIVFLLLLLSFHLCRSPLHTPIFDVIYLTWFHHYLAKHIYFYLTHSLRLLVFSCDLCAMFFFLFSFAALAGFKGCVCRCGWWMSNFNVETILKYLPFWWNYFLVIDF